MLAGHFATALVARQHTPTAPLAFYLVISQLPDFVWQVLHFAGVEPTTPSNPMLVSLDNMQTEMTYSHDVLPSLLWVGLATAVGRGWFGDWRTGLTAGVLVVVHVLCDWLSGFPHHVFGPHTAEVGLGLYGSAPYLALGVEALFTVVVMAGVFWKDAVDGVRRSRTTLVVWAAVLLGGIAILVPNADLSLVELTGWAPVGALTGAAVPVLVVTYVGMLAALIWADSGD